MVVRRTGRVRLSRAAFRACVTMVLVLVCIVLAACSSQAPETPEACTVSARLVPTCGVFLGVTPQDPTPAGLARADEAATRPYDFVYRFHDIDDSVPDDFDRSVVASGRHLHLSIDVRSHTPGGRTYGWRDVANGVVDRELTTQAKGIASLSTPIWVTFDHEPDNSSKMSRGTGADFVAAWRHVHDLFVASGASNAVWVWVVTGEKDGLNRVERFWPGNDDVDWISWESYNPAGCRVGKFDGSRWTSFESALLVFHDWLRDNAARVGIDSGKPQMISEAGSVEDPSDAGRRAKWYQDIATSLARYPQVKAIGLWDHTGNGACDYRFSDLPAVQAGVDAVMSSANVDATASR